MQLSQTVSMKMHRAKGDLEARPSLTRALAVKGSSAKLTAIFDEIDETLLPRMLSFEIAGKAMLQMDVGSRRMFHVVLIEPATLAPITGLATSGRDDANIAAQVKEIAEALVAFVKVPGEIEVMSRMTSKPYSSSEVGFTAQELRNACAPYDLEDRLDAALDDTFDAEVEEVAPATPAPVAAPAPPAPEKKSVAVAAPAPAPAPAAPPQPAAPKPAPAAEAAPAPKRDPLTTEEFYEACRVFALNGIKLAPDGAVLGVFGDGVQETWLDISGHAAGDFARWIEVAGWALGKDQFLVLKGPKFEDTSVGVLFKDGQYVALTLRNLDLNKVMKLALEVLDTGEA